MEHSPALWVQVVGAVWFALVVYHAFVWALRRHFTSESRNAMRWLAVAGLIGLFGGSWVYTVIG